MQSIDESSFLPGRSTITVSDILRREIDEFIVDFRKTSRLFERARSGAVCPRTIGQYLRSIQFLFRQTPIHLSLAEDRAFGAGRLALAAHYAHKKTEEEGHDRWAEADLERVAATFKIQVADHPTPTMRELVAANVEGIIRDPLYYLVYMVFVESFAVATGPEWIRMLSENCGVSASHLTAVENHAELDKDHADEGYARIDEFVSVEQVGPLQEALVGMKGRLSNFANELSDLKWS